jgi:outer membrane protein
MSRNLLIVFAAALAPRLAAAQRADTLRLSLPDAVALALRTSDETRLSAAQIEIGDAQFGSARSTGLPQLRINSSYQHAWQSARASAVGSVFNQPNTYNTSLTLSQTLFQGGRIVAGARAAAELRDASQFNDQETRARLTVDLQRAYLNVLFTARMVEIQQTNMALAGSRAQQVEQLQSAGRAARYDVLRARVESANIEPLVIQARNDRDLAMLELKRILNIPLDRPLELTTAIEASALRAALVAFADSSAALVPDRASTRSAALVASARRAAIAVARADFLPSISVSAQMGFQAFPPLGFGFPRSGGTLGEAYCPPGSTAGRECQNGGWFSDRSMTATISFPVFDGFRAKSNLDLARAQARLSDVQFQMQTETVALEVARARAELKRSRSVFDARMQNSSEAGEAFQLASLRFSRGLSTQLEVSDAQFALLTAQSSEARATYDLYLATAELSRALGRPIPFPPTATPGRSADTGAPK